MEMKFDNVDAGRPFDWGRTSEDYARYRDIYPPVFYEKILNRNLCQKGQRVLDLATGTGVLPRNLYARGARWTGTDISAEQIAQAKRLSRAQNMNIEYLVSAVEELEFPPDTFDVVTACQCYWYFDFGRLLPGLRRMMKADGSFLLLYMAWLPYEDPIARASEELVLRYSPSWTGAGETMHPIPVPESGMEDFEAVYHEEYRVDVPFTRESWNGRMKACRGVGASLPPEQIRQWEKEHKKLLDEIAPERFQIRHFVAMLELRKSNSETGRRNCSEKKTVW